MFVVPNSVPLVRFSVVNKDGTIYKDGQIGVFPEQTYEIKLSLGGHRSGQMFQMRDGQIFNVTLRCVAWAHQFLTRRMPVLRYTVFYRKTSPMMRPTNQSVELD